MQPVIRAFYMVFLAFMITLLIGLGIDTFYPRPTMPTYPTVLNIPAGDKAGVMSDEQIEAQKKFDEDMASYDTASKEHARNVSMWTVGISVVLLIISLTALIKVSLMANAILLSSIFTLIYSIINGFMSEDNKIRFMVVAVGVVLALIVGYIKLMKKPDGKNPTAPAAV